MNRIDFIIVGQGLAGTTLAWQLRRRGRSVLLLDREPAVSASRVAAGLITPVTGKRLAASWRWQELEPVAVRFYRSVEAETGRRFLHQRPAVRLFANEAERDEFRRRAGPAEDGPVPCIRSLVRVTTELPRGLEAALGGFEMPDAARLDVPAYLTASREVFAARGEYSRADLDLRSDVRIDPDRVRLPRLGFEAGALILCRGYTSDADPWFGSVPFQAAKGEILTLRIPAYQEARTVHRGLWLAPAGGECYRCGATYTWEPLDCEPTATGRAEIEQRLSAFLRLPYEVVEHRAAVRPVVDAGTPVLGRHPAFPRLAFFNGLGSKGSLLAPFFAEQLAACLREEREPDPGIDVRRYLRQP
jgi:glycine/D-amino acid oxidase-like deaminating enzyme